MKAQCRLSILFLAIILASSISAVIGDKVKGFFRRETKEQKQERKINELLDCMPKMNELETLFNNGYKGHEGKIPMHKALEVQKRICEAKPAKCFKIISESMDIFNSNMGDIDEKL